MSPRLFCGGMKSLTCLAFLACRCDSREASPVLSWKCSGPLANPHPHSPPRASSSGKRPSQPPCLTAVSDEYQPSSLQWENFKVCVACIFPREPTGTCAPGAHSGTLLITSPCMDFLCFPSHFPLVPPGITSQASTCTQLLSSNSASEGS